MNELIISNEPTVEYVRTEATPERCTLARIIVQGRLVTLETVTGKRMRLQTGGMCYEYKLNPALWADDAVWMFRFKQVEG